MWLPLWFSKSRNPHVSRLLDLWQAQKSGLDSDNEAIDAVNTDQLPVFPLLIATRWCPRDRVATS